MSQKSVRNHKLSANEINRYVYCPYQWYYKRVYGQKELQKRYKALGIQGSQHANFYTKGSKYHLKYHREYHMRRVFWAVTLLLILFALLGVVQRWL